MRLSLFVLIAALPARADDWAQFQGPRGNGTSAERGLLREWPAEGPPVLWRAPIKMGWSSPSVSGDDVLVAWTEELRGSAETVACLSAADGHLKWKTTYEVGPYWKRNIGWAPGGFRATPAVDSERVYTLGAIGHFHALERKTGKILWARNLWNDHTPSGEKGYSGSPLVVGKKLIVYYGDGSARMDDPEKVRGVLCRAFDPATGDVLWTFFEPHIETASMGEGQTPAVVEIGGRTCVVFTGNCSLIALAADDGKQVWRSEPYRKEARGTTIPTPLVLERLMVNIPDGDGIRAVSYDPAHPEIPSATVWKQDLSTFCAIHQFRPREGYLYGFLGALEGESDRKASESKVKLACLDAATGKVKWSESGFRAGFAHIEADGLLFVRSYQELSLIEATPEAFRRCGRVKTHECTKPTVNLVDFVMPVLSKGRLLIRTPDELICYGVAK